MEDAAALYPAKPAAHPHITIQLLGTFRVTVGAEVVPDAPWRRRKAGALLKLLALAPGRTLARDEVLAALWPELAPETAAENLRQALHAARAALTAAGAAEGTLARQGEQLALAPDDALGIDAADFARMALAARGDDPAPYEAALALYPGDLLPADRYEDWAAGPRETLRATSLRLLDRAAAVHAVRGDTARALVALERLVAAEPTDEEAHVALMRAHALAGRRGRALHTFARLRAALRRDLDVAPLPETLTLHRAIADRSFPPAGAARRDNLPAPLTSFIGRATERAALVALLTDAAAPRALTLTGAGGGGKTRLALAVARDLVATDTYPDGVWIVDLAPLADPLLVPEAVAAALGIGATAGGTIVETLATALAPKRLLLLLDNCEHLADACAALVAPLLAAAPGVRILATSRAALHLPGEMLHRVPPLAVPPPGAHDPASVGASDAVQLFVDRARWRRPDFAVDRDNAAALATICGGLDGLPLALELAAARIELLPPVALAARLDDALALLQGGDRAAPSRQRTLRATLDWSYDLLGGEERALLRRLAAFSGGFTLDAAEAVCADDALPVGAILGALAGLLDQSLALAPDGDGASRFALAETVRQYAAARLAEAGEDAATYARHAAHFLALAEGADAGLQGPEQGAWLARLDAEHENVRAALGRALAGGPDPLVPGTVLRIGWAVRQFWVVRGHFAEGRRWIVASLAQPPAPDDADAARLRARGLSVAGRLAWCQGEYAAAEAFHADELALARASGARQEIATALNNLGNARYHQGDHAAARPLYEEGLSLRRALGDRAAVSASLNNLSNVAYDQGDFRGSVAFAEESLAIKRALGDRRGVAITLNNLGNKWYWEGDHERARALIEESLAIKRELGDRQNIAIALNCLGELALVGGDPAAARARYAESLTISRVVDDRWSTVVALEGLAACAALTGLAARAARVWGCAEALREAINARMDPASLASYERTVAAARATLLVAEWAAAWGHGRALPLAEASASALEPLGTRALAAPGATLSAREGEIAALVAAGQTNAQVAAVLGIAPRTVDTHVGAILRKLGLASRTQLASRLAAQQHPSPATPG